MSRTNYDYFQLFTPEGTVKPLAYLTKSVELGNIAIGVTTKKCGILIAHTNTKNKNPKNEKSEDNKSAENTNINNDTNSNTNETNISSNRIDVNKIFKIDNHSIFTFSGITNDGLLLVDYLINKSINENIIYNMDITEDVFEEIGFQAGLRTMAARERPFGVGGLMLNYNKERDEVCLTEFKPTGEVFRCYGASVGRRSQGAITILERDYGDLDFDGIVELGIRAMRNALSELEKDDIEIWGVDSEKGIFKVDKDKYF